MVHIHAAYALTRSNQRARAGSYDQRDYVAANYAIAHHAVDRASSSLLFLVWHLADLTWGWDRNPDFVRGAVYENVVASLSRVAGGLLYMVASSPSALHICPRRLEPLPEHGLINNPRFNRWRRDLRHRLRRRRHRRATLLAHRRASSGVVA